MFSNSNSDFKVAISSGSSIGCTDTVITSSVSCIFPIEITSIADSPKSLSGNFFAVVDGKIYLADTSYGGIDSISETWNPGESKSGIVPFSVPRNSSISSIFLGPDGSSSTDDAVLSLTVSVVAVDGWTPKLQQRLSELTSVQDIVSRLTKSSGYFWKKYDAEEPSEATYISIEYDEYIEGSYSCFSTISPNIYNYLGGENRAVYEDLKSGLVISFVELVIVDSVISGDEARFCRSLFESTTGFRRVQ